MTKSDWKLGTVFVLAALVAITFGSKSATAVQATTDGELSMVYGGGCQGPKADPDFCAQEAGCAPQGSGTVKVRGTGAFKVWCTATALLQKVCDCNQTGVAQSTCTESLLCAQPDCQNCERWVPMTTVQSTVNLNGQPCPDGSCE